MELAPRHNVQQGIFRWAWIPLALILAYSLISIGGMVWTEALTVAVSIALISQFISYAAWYSCRLTPLQRSNIYRVLLTHFVSALVLSFLWVALSRLLVKALSFFPWMRDVQAHFAPDLWVVYIVGVFFYLISVALYYLVIAQQASREAETRAMETGLQARDAELRALKAQINPHFLFNSLNSISALTIVDPSRAREMCLLLAEFLRMTLGMGEKAVIPFSEELALVERFLAIEKVRFGARLNLDQEIADDCRSCLIQPLLLQPLVENAVAHGIANLPEGGCVRLSARKEGERLLVQVKNSYDPEAPLGRGGGLGLKNVQQRLEARYGKDASLRISSEGETFQVILSMPAELEEKAVAR